MSAIDDTFAPTLQHDLPLPCRHAGQDGQRQIASGLAVSNSFAAHGQVTRPTPRCDKSTLMDNNAAVVCARRIPSDRNNFEQAIVWILEIAATPAASMVDSHVVRRERSTAIGETLVPDALEDPIELSVTHLEGVVQSKVVRASKSRTNVSFTRMGAKCEAAPS